MTETTDEALARAARELEDARRDTEALADRDGASTDLVTTSKTAALARREMAAQQAEIARMRKRLVQKANEFRDLAERQAREAELVLGPLEDRVSALKEAIWTVNLYLGRKEEIRKLADGKAAPADEVLSIRQMVLAMDEECAVAAEEGGIDALSIDEFDKWLVADPAHLQQVLPERKGVVALRPTGKTKDYGDPWRNDAMREKNNQTYFLIRNGEKLWRTWTKFKTGDVLMPTGDEFLKFFEERRYNSETREYDVVPLTPGTRAWERAQDSADARRRHYMRVALILEGLLHRTTVFHPLPPEGVSFVDPAHHEAGRVRFILDAEQALTTGREPFKDWLKRLNGRLNTGMRIAGLFGGWKEGLHQYDYEHNRGNERLHPQGAEFPDSYVLHTIEDARTVGGGRELTIRYARENEVYDPRLWVETRPGWGYYGGYKTPKQRASCKLLTTDDFILPFDLVTVEEMESYLLARGERREFARMFPLLKHAIRVKRQEAKDEAPFLTMLAGVLARENEVSVEAAQADLPALVDWWKFKNKAHRPLRLADLGDQSEYYSPRGRRKKGPSAKQVDAAKDTRVAHEAKAVREIVAEHRRVLADRRRPIRKEIVDALRAKHPTALVIARPRRGGYVVADAEHPTENVFIRETYYSAYGVFTDERRWQLLGKRAWRWTIAHTSPRWDEWDFETTEGRHLTDPEMAHAVQRLRGMHEGACVIAYDERDATFDVWTPEKRKRGEEPDFDYAQVKWSRRGDEIKLAASHTWGTPGWGGYEGVPWRDTRVLYIDDGPVDKVVKARAAYEERSRAARERSWGHIERLNEIEAAWTKAQEARAHAEFMVEYGEPDLWPGHLKANPVAKWPYGTRDHHKDPVEQALLKVIATLPDDYEFAGRTVEQARNDAQVDVELPADVLGLKWAEARAEPDDEEDDNEDLEWVE